MKKQLYQLGCIALFSVGTLVHAQIGVNNEDPQATVDISAKTSTGTTAEGILIPRVSKVKAEAMGGNTEESTLVYIKEVATAPTSVSYTSNVDAKGFYYFEGGKWQKIGGNGSSSTTTLGTITGNLRIVTQITPQEWAKPNTFALVQTGNLQIQLPNPANYIGKIISVNNQYNRSVGYSGTNQPKNVASLASGKGHILMAGIDTTNNNTPTWFLIGGSY